MEPDTRSIKENISVKLSFKGGKKKQPYFRVHSHVVLMRIPRHSVPIVHYSTVKTLLKANTVLCEDKLQQIQLIKKKIIIMERINSTPPSDWVSPALSLSLQGPRTFAPGPVLVYNPCLSHAALRGPEVGSVLSVLAGSASFGGTTEVWGPVEVVEEALQTGEDHSKGLPCFLVYQDLN